MNERVFNFSPGPAVIPVEVLTTVKENLLNYQETGLGVMEMSHRGAHFEAILDTAIKDIKELLGIGESHAVIFTTGGATQQFSMIPMNLLKSGKVADFIVTGYWAEKAFAEAKKFGEVHLAGSSKDKEYSYIPKNLNFSANSAYVHYTSNNTIYGTQFTAEPAVNGRILICDASSDIMHKKIDVSKYGIIYGGAQKNLGPSGITLVIIRKDLLALSPQGLPILLDYNTYVNNNSLYNTIPTFPIYVVAEVLKWIKKQGGLGVIEKNNREKAQTLYKAIDENEFYSGTAEKDSRSIMNVTFRLKNKDLEPTFVKEAEAQKLSGLKGHKAVGGIRASIYNAFPLEGVKQLVSFMQDFAKKHG